MLCNIKLVLPYINMNLPQMYTCSPSFTPSHLSPHTIPLGHPSAPALSILYPASNLDWQFITYMILYMFQGHSPKSSHPRPLPQSPKDCSIHRCLFCCHAYRLYRLGFPGGLEVKASPWNAGDLGLILGSGRSPGEGKWQPTPVLLPGESHGGRSLVGYSPWGRKESGTTERLHFHFHFTFIQGYCYHLSIFHIYALVHCIGVLLSGLLHSV